MDIAELIRSADPSRIAALKRKLLLCCAAADGVGVANEQWRKAIEMMDVNPQALAGCNRMLTDLVEAELGNAKG